MLPRAAITVSNHLNLAKDSQRVSGEVNQRRKTFMKS